MLPVPTGTLTFLFTDIEGSKQRWEHQREASSAALVRHDEILRSATAEKLSAADRIVVATSPPRSSRAKAEAHSTTVPHHTTMSPSSSSKGRTRSLAGWVKCR